MTTTDADAYRRLDEALKAHRGDADAYRRLGGQLQARRHLLDPRYGNRRQFVRERLVPLGLKETAAYKLVYDIEHGTLQGRGGYSAGNMLALAQAYGTTPESVAGVLDGGELGPLPRASGQPGPASGPAVPPGFASPEMIERARPYANEIWRRVLSLAAKAGYAPDPGTAGEVPDPGGEALFPGSEEDRIAWDSAAGRPALARTWLVAVLQSAVASARERGAGLAAVPGRVSRLPDGHDPPEAEVSGGWLLRDREP